MLKKFREYTRDHDMFNHGSKVLLAVSGGLDSVVMAHLFHKAGINAGIAHCNFKLRDDESERDEQFVKELSLRLKYPFHVIGFNTRQFAKDNSLSVQMAARRLRYHWFHSVMDETGYDVVAIAHHADDVAETMIMNLIRGTGLAGMHGIKPVRGRVIRPLLFATRFELEQYAEENMLTWSEDSSNSEATYLRNKIRHHIIPVMREINENTVGALVHHASLMEGYEKLTHEYLEKLSQSVILENGEGAVIAFSKDGILSSPSPGIILYHLLKPFGITPSMSVQVLSVKTPGKIFETEKFRIIVERDRISVFDLVSHHDVEHIWTDVEELLNLEGGFIDSKLVPAFGVTKIAELPGIENSDSAFVDEELLRFPLTVRKWRHGDTFRPIGMKGRKLVSDFMTDEKFSLSAKESLHLLLSGEEIVWLIGHRLDDRFKLTDQTRKCRMFRFHSDENRN